MTLQEAKDQAAKEWDAAFDYHSLRNGVQVGNIKMMHLDKVNDRASELYARSKWDEACKAQHDECIKIYYEDKYPEAAPKPEFKP